jgi:hypothetical protein
MAHRINPWLPHTPESLPYLDQIVDVVVISAHLGDRCRDRDEKFTG